MVVVVVLAVAAAVVVVAAIAVAVAIDIVTGLNIFRTEKFLLYIWLGSHSI